MIHVNMFDELCGICFMLLLTRIVILGEFFVNVYFVHVKV